MVDYRSNDEREAILENGNVIKYHKFEIRKDIFVRKPEWIFSPRIGWNRMPEEVVKQITDCNCMWDYYGKIIEDENYADLEVGRRNQFFVMKSSGEWKFRISPSFCIFDGFWKPFVPQKPKKKFTLLGGMKIYSKQDKFLWTMKVILLKDSVQENH
jgi:hypothetical protein